MPLIVKEILMPNLAVVVEKLKPLLQLLVTM
jgi:hypothetical protein